jgi:hypothetical protein
MLFLVASEENYFNREIGEEKYVGLSALQFFVRSIIANRGVRFSVARASACGGWTLQGQNAAG